MSSTTTPNDEAQPRLSRFRIIQVCLVACTLMAVATIIFIVIRWWSQGLAGLDSAAATVLVIGMSLTCGLFLTALIMLGIGRRQGQEETAEEAGQAEEAGDPDTEAAAEAVPADQTVPEPVAVAAEHQPVVPAEEAEGQGWSKASELANNIIATD